MTQTCSPRIASNATFGEKYTIRASCNLRVSSIALIGRIAHLGHRSDGKNQVGSTKGLEQNRAATAAREHEHDQTELRQRAWLPVASLRFFQQDGELCSDRSQTCQQMQFAPVRCVHWQLTDAAVELPLATAETDLTEQPESRHVLLARSR